MDRSTDAYPPPTIAARRGRPRSHETDAAIEAAAWAILGQRGFDGMTFEAVAELAGCSRSTMYRRFSSKLELVEAMLNGSSQTLRHDAPPDGTPREMLISYLSHSNASLVGTRRHAILSILESGSRIPELGDVIDRYMAEQKSDYFFAQFQRVSEIELDVEFCDFLYDSLAGAMIYNLAVRARTLGWEQIGMLVDQALMLARNYDPQAWLDAQASPPPTPHNARVA